ncbi:TY-Chap domain-containing protein [Nocardioides sp.]|uniref:TY-Chap domain-containing protein n=1 Tax=Nocardioides sp. TaxID=35761 RepID=UPI002B270AD8|nr:hypothetical protein [Nocardioides sp.]
MRGDWNDLNRRLTSSLIALDLDDSLIIGEKVEPARKGIFGQAKAAPARPRRYVQATAARDFLVGEVVGATAFGGEWEMSQETIDTLLSKGWEKPWSQDYRTFSRQTPLISANRLALQLVRALQLLGCEVADLDVEFVRGET